MATPDKLSGKQLRHLRGLAHSLNPVVQVGKHGWTDAVADQLERALTDHELIKVRLGAECPTELGEFTAFASEALSAHVAQVIGKTAVLYRRHPQKPKIELPRG